MRTRRYYFSETYYHHLTDRRRDEQEMSQYGEVHHDDRGAYWLIARPKKEVVAALTKLGYTLDVSFPAVTLPAPPPQLREG